LERFPVSSR